MIELTDEFRERLSTAMTDGFPVVRDQVFDASPEFERNQDPDRFGIAIVVELTRVRGRGFLWERDAGT